MHARRKALRADDSFDVSEDHTAIENKSGSYKNISRTLNALTFSNCVLQNLIARRFDRCR